MRFALIGAIALLVLIGNASAQQRQLQQPRNQPNQQQAAPDTRGTEQAPFIVKTVPTEKSETDKQTEKDKSDLDRKLTEFTGDLAFYTKWLFIVTAGVVFGTFGLVITGFLQISDNKKAIGAAQTSASYCRILVTVGVRRRLEGVA
jgi:hypothetical protein